MTALLLPLCPLTNSRRHGIPDTNPGIFGLEEVFGGSKAKSSLLRVPLRIILCAVMRFSFFAFSFSPSLLFFFFISVLAWFVSFAFFFSWYADPGVATRVVSYVQCTRIR